jgi:hypothetical protein
MHRVPILFPLAAALAAAATSLPAQNLTIGDGNMVFTTVAPSASSTLPCAANLIGDAMGTDHAFEHWWYFRVSGDASEMPLRLVGTVVRSVAPSGTHLDSDFDDIESRGLFRARLDGDVYSAGPASGVVISRLSLLNISGAPQTVSVFAYLDLDVAGTFGDDYAVGDDQHQVVTDASGVRIEFRARGSDFGDLGVYPSLRNQLSNGSITALSGAHSPILGADYTGAFEWRDRVVQPGEWVTFTTLIAVDTAANFPPITEQYGSASGHGVEICTDGIALQNNAAPRAIDVHLMGATPNSFAGLLSSIAPASGIPFLGVVLWADPFTEFQFPISMTDSSGELAFHFPIPPTGSYLTGYPVYHQFFVSNPLAPGGVADWTGGLKTIVGKL